MRRIAALGAPARELLLARINAHELAVLSAISALAEAGAYRWLNGLTVMRSGE